jgi:hypothetical protein
VSNIDRALKLAMATSDELIEAAVRLKARLPDPGPGTTMERVITDWDGSAGAFCEVRDELKRRGQWEEEMFPRV